MVFDTRLFQSDPKVNTCITCLRTDFLTNWLTDYQKKINKWIIKWINVSSMPFWFVTENEEIKGKRRFLKTSKLQSPNQGSLTMEFLLLSLESVCMILIKALRGMQLIGNEEKMLRWQTHDCNVWRHVNPWAYRSQFPVTFACLEAKK